MSLAQPDLANELPPVLKTGLGRPILGVYVIIVFGVLGFLLWAATAPLHGGAVMSGHVGIENSRQTVQHLEGGIVAEILVRDGSVVKAGDVLLRLRDVRASSTLQVTRDRLFASLAQRARLIAERDEAAEITFPPRLLEAASSQAVAEQIEAQRISFQSRRQTRDGQVMILLQRIEQLGKQRDGLQAQLVATDEQLATIAKELVGLRRLYADGLAARSRILALERTEAELNGRKGQLISEIARNEVAAGEARLQIDQTRSAFRTEVVQNLETVERDIATLDEQSTAAADQVDRTAVRAPIGGIVVGLSIHTEGGVLAPGARIMDIVPQGQPLVVEAFVSPTDVDKVTAGEEAEIRFTTFSARKTPAIFGTVERVSADVMNDPQNKQAFYLARVTVPESEVKRLGEVHLLPGMPVELIVRTDERTALDYLVRPMIDMFARSFKED